MTLNICYQSVSQGMIKLQQGSMKTGHFYFGLTCDKAGIDNFNFCCYYLTLNE